MNCQYFKFFLVLIITINTLPMAWCTQEPPLQNSCQRLRGHLRVNRSLADGVERMIRRALRRVPLLPNSQQANLRNLRDINIREIPLEQSQSAKITRYQQAKQRLMSYETYLQEQSNTDDLQTEISQYKQKIDLLIGHYECRQQQLAVSMRNNTPINEQAKLEEGENCAYAEANNHYQRLKSLIGRYYYSNRPFGIPSNNESLFGPYHSSIRSFNYIQAMASLPSNAGVAGEYLNHLENIGFALSAVYQSAGNRSYQASALAEARNELGLLKRKLQECIEHLPIVTETTLCGEEGIDFAQTGEQIRQQMSAFLSSLSMTIGVNENRSFQRTMRRLRRQNNFLAGNYMRGLSFYNQMKVYLNVIKTFLSQNNQFQNQFQRPLRGLEQNVNIMIGKYQCLADKQGHRSNRPAANSQ